MNGNITLIFLGAKSTANTLGTGVGIYVPTGGFASIHGKQYTIITSFDEITSLSSIL
ncbi:hypothetical protein SAMD00019534_080510 [Acytostelium subglobosum LB1]|uniref:hypothetical protein n=1 Tax=Acytostelium subglobosum LB1 TaxID=1410327 RepID=UPI000644F15E|nr:hypothetical protein SAMD00019534_080510 [Acytostelium subglobosum LB1]GAM24876.1 hypothetical protein SAMD00019534_080510 [Acytostelium subglobosum LB1]|eukprot:XP_012751965.1 hypothetical protein SAMD00019534_080510 [Acytostelium subglobosum LB1]